MSDSNPILPVDSILPDELFLIPLVNRPIFPGIFTPFTLEYKDDIKTVEKAIRGNRLIGMVLLKSHTDKKEGPLEIEFAPVGGEDDADGDEEHPSIDDARVKTRRNRLLPAHFYKVGTVARIVKKINLPGGAVTVFISTIKRFKIVNFITESPLFRAKVAYQDDIYPDKKTLSALNRNLLLGVKTIAENNPMITDEFKLNIVNISDPGQMANFISTVLNLTKEEQQEILQTNNLKTRLEKVLIFLKREEEVKAVTQKIAKRINQKVEKNQREYFLREELEAIKKELGIAGDLHSMEAEKYLRKMKRFAFSDEVAEVVQNEIDKFQLMEPNSSDYFVTKNYLDTVFALPWQEAKEPSVSIQRARAVLNKDHYGLKEVKERILELIAVRKLKPDPKGSILCLVGPPGVGKTSVGKSIARALGKKFFRFSVGGMRDEAEIKGHRRTYVASMPGKILQGLKIVKTKNPVFLIDEIDKIGASVQGDPASALLEVLDPEQNVAFRDHYLDLPFDLSHILFIVTANTLDPIPRPLLDRMEVIELSGYITEEKVQIAQKYLIPKNLAKNGLEKGQLTFSNAILTEIIQKYARESGVRHLEQQLDKICRKFAKKWVIGDAAPPYALQSADLIPMLGQPWFNPDEIKSANRPGMAVGLAWTAMGGDTLIIESVAIPNERGGLKLTGKMGSVMQESASIAHSYIHSIAAHVAIDPLFFDKNLIHLHIPEGATPKDGPSAGITMATALLSLAKNQTIKPHLAMTGELSLTGEVLPIGGLKEKTIAAKMNRIETLLIPKNNLKDLDEIPDFIKKGIRFVPVSRMEEVIQEIF